MNDSISLAIICTRWNKELVEKLLAGATQAIEDAQPSRGRLQWKVYWVGGAFELPAFARFIAQHFDAVICFGVVIRGQTDHYHYIASESARLIAQATYDTSVPVLFGVLTVSNRRQAKKRCQNNRKNKGYITLQTALETIDTYRTFLRDKKQLETKNS